MPSYTAKAVRSTILRSQALSGINKENLRPNRESIVRIVNKIIALQIDTLQMVNRSHYVAVWSRLGNYETKLLDDLCYGYGNQLCEYWYHAACIISLEEYKYRNPAMIQHSKMESVRWSKYKFDIDFHALVRDVKNRLRVEGPLKASDFANPRVRRGPWWDWKPAKRALEYLYDSGQAFVTDRFNFQKVYKLTSDDIERERCKSIISFEDSIIHDLEMALIAMGVCTIQQVGDYTHMKKTTAAPYVKKLIEERKACEISATNYLGKSVGMIVHRSNLNLLNQAMEGEIEPTRTTFLSPFDSLFWAKGRDVEFFSFNQTLECYKPKNIRKWGYFCLPVLHKDQLVGRFDPKLDRRSGTLHIRAFHLEPGVYPEEELVSGTATAMKDFLSFHQAKGITFSNKGDKEFITKLQRSL